MFRRKRIDENPLIVSYSPSKQTLNKTISLVEQQDGGGGGKDHRRLRLTTGCGSTAAAKVKLSPFQFIMEESEKRRERLRAMRVEATADVDSSSQTLISTPLGNPLLENPNSNTPSTAPRFDFYTDPVAAYATNKHRPFTPTPHISPSQCGPRNHGMPLSGNQPNQFHNNYGPNQGVYQGGDPYHSPGPTSDPMGMRSAYPVHQGSQNFNTAYPSPGLDYGRGNWLNNHPRPGPGNTSGLYPVYQGSPDFRPPFPPQGMGQWSNNSPTPPGHGGGLQGRGQWPNNSPGYGGCPQGRGQWSNNGPSPGRGGGPSPHVGRGRGQHDGNRMSHSSRYLGGRGKGRGSHGNGESREFYQKSMVEDPWKSLTPVIWKGAKENDVKGSTSNQGSTPSSKKLRVSNPSDAVNSKKGGSLADYLAEAFDD